MIRLVYIIALLLLASCSQRPRNRPATPDVLPTVTLIDKLKLKRNLYLVLQKSIVTGNGWSRIDHCDGLLFNSLMGASGNDVKIEAAKDESGKWFRRPQKNCYSSNRTSSENSNDMRLGMFWYFLKHKRLDLAEALFQYGEENIWKMGENRGKDFRHIMTPQMQATLADIIISLGGKTHREHKIPEFWMTYDLENIKKNIPLRGFRAHLMVLHILLRGEVHGGITDHALLALKIFAKDQPHNPLFQTAYIKYTTGDYTEAIKLLLDNKYWPNDRLPTSADRCEQWIIQRDFGNGELHKCPAEGYKHAGGELTFTAALILNDWPSQ